ncbi:glucosidase 2 subunit beta [Sitophilus oryzae]|uniref:Glucosidase 2 subunit beta n=1 Tax=Sitophilus oryzae TaxID=7048 RepID=A0A6J2YW02_SITOR|nr:glucosidase 2 subunit beta [Sitophilus oryzae]
MKLNKFYANFKLKCLYIILVLIELSDSKAEVPRPRGVALSRAPLYDPDTNFTCFDGSKTIPYNQVNDDYCDCEDSSDEPGTSACAGGSFYCLNAGYKPSILKSDRVNDGICDCCDGSDEYSGRKTCVNNCQEMGKAAREEAFRLAELLKVGKQLRAELSQEGLKMKNEKQQKLGELQKHKEEAEKIKSEREELKKKAEEVEGKALEYYKELEEQYKKQRAEKEAEKLQQEAVENFKKLDSNQDGLVEIAELQSRQSFDRDRNGEVSEEEAKLFLNNQESVDLETFIEKSWPLMKPFVKIDSGMFKPPETTSEAESEDLQDQEEELKVEFGESEHEEGGEEDEDEDNEKEEQPEEHEEEEHYITYDEETQKLVDLASEARNHYSEAEKDVRSINDQIRDLEQSLKKDFGPDEEFASLEGQCFDYTDHEYVYKLCPFEKSLQIPKSSSSETNLGRWSKWDGPNNNPYEIMLYEHGQNCWNGPNRSTRVKLSCGAESKVTSVSEPNRCEYAFEFQTPAACREVSSAEGKDGDLHDEL